MEHNFLPWATKEKLNRHDTLVVAVVHDDKEGNEDGEIDRQSGAGAAVEQNSSADSQAVGKTKGTRRRSIANTKNSKDRRGSIAKKDAKTKSKPKKGKPK